jgi:hypothetical protein
LFARASSFPASSAATDAFQLLRLLTESLLVAARHETNYPEAIRMRAHDVYRLPADRAGRSEDHDAALSVHGQIVTRRGR